MTRCSAYIVGALSLESPRPSPGKPGYVTLDAGIYLPGRPSEEAAIAALRFYNAPRWTFPEEGGLYFVVAKIVAMKKGTETPSPSLEEADYDLIGDIVQLIPIDSPDAVDPSAHRVLVMVTGLAHSINFKTFTFKVDISQWVSADAQGVLPLTMRIPEESKWKDHPSKLKAMLTEQTIVSVIGTLTGIEHGKNRFPTRFFLDVDRHLEHIHRINAQPTTPSPAGDTKGSGGKLRWAGRRKNPRQHDEPTSPSPTIRLGKQAERVNSDDDDMYADPPVAANGVSEPIECSSPDEPIAKRRRTAGPPGSD